MKSIAIIGAGPAGMKAATVLSGLDFNVTVFDEQPSLGGQIYRNIEHLDENIAARLGPDYVHGSSLATDFRAKLDSERLNYIPDAAVWGVSDQKVLHWKMKGQTYSQSFDYFILATGAIERPMPLPGWTLPRVMTVGGGQILLKSSAVALKNSVLIGSGPLLYLMASQLIKFGSPPTALIETQSLKDQIVGGLKLRPSQVTFKYIAKGLKLLATIKRAGVPRFTAANDVSIAAKGDQLNIEFNAGKTRNSLTADHALLHCGVIPNTHLSRAMDIQHEWDALNQCFAPSVDETGKAKGFDNIWVAGDGAKILGADAAEVSGEVAALAIAQAEGHHREVTAQMATKTAEKSDYVSIRAFLDTTYAPPSWLLNPADSTIICRCEEITAGEIRTAIKSGAHGPNQAKAFTRCGMGNCQGRYCGHTVTNIFAAEKKVTPADVGYYRIRSPIKPLTLQELATHEHKH